jgi:CheY-like chemotaxis protein
MARVLYVDDDRASRDILLRLLKHRNLDVDVVDSAQAALNSAQDAVYDLIVIDLALPDIDGWELLRHLQADSNATWKAAALTAYYDASIARQARQAGFAACLPKPATTQTAEALQSLLL